MGAGDYVAEITATHKRLCLLFLHVNNISMPDNKGEYFSNDTGCPLTMRSQDRNVVSCDKEENRWAI